MKRSSKQKKDMQLQNIKERVEKQKNYVNNWHVSEGLKSYQPLQDTYSTYYFANPKTQKHMRHLQKIVKKQTKTKEVLRLTFLLQNRFRRRNSNSINQQEKKCNEKDSQGNSIIKSYEKDLKPQSLQKLRKNKYQLRGQSNLDEQRYQKERENKNQYANMNRAQSCDNRLPKVKHSKVYQSKNQLDRNKIKPTNKTYFVQYLQKKKQQLQKNRESLKSEEQK